MKKHVVKTVSAAILMLVSGAVLASEVFDVWGYGMTWGEARDDARMTGFQACTSKGYSGAYVEEVQTYESGGGYVSYGIAQCY